MGVLATCLSYGPPVLRDATVDSTLLTELQAAQEDQRANINVVPGEGSVLGVWQYGANVYAFRNKSGGATAGMYKSTSTGWEEVDLGTALNFDGTTTDGEPVPGDTGTPTTIVGADGAQGDLAGISYHGLWETGAAGTMVLTNVTGTFVDNENLTMPLLAFDTGSETISEGDTITGATSGKTAEVTSVVITTGTVAGGDAEGYMSVKNNSGTWTNS